MATNNTVANVTNMAAILKTVWPQSAIQDLFYEDAPALAMIPKDTSWSGDTRAIALQYGQINGRSASVTRAIANVGNTKTAEMNITTADNFAVWRVDHKLMQLSRNDKGSLVRAVESQTKSAMKRFKRSLCGQIYGTGQGSGSIGTIASTADNTHFVFTSARSLRYIEVGDYLDFSTADGTGSVRGSGPWEITAIDPDTKTVTLGSAATHAAADYVFINGDHAAVCYGFEAYVPSSAPATTIWGMSRTAQSRRLGGVRVGGKNLLIQEAVKKALKVAKDETAAVSHCFMSSGDFYNLEMALGTNKRYCDEKVAGVGFTGIEFISGGSKPLKVFMDADCPDNIVWLLDMDTWTMASAGEIPSFIGMDDQKYNLLEGANTFEGRIGGYYQLYTDAPGYNVRLDLTAA